MHRILRWNLVKNIDIVVHSFILCFDDREREMEMGLERRSQEEQKHPYKVTDEWSL